MQDTSLRSGSQKMGKPSWKAMVLHAVRSLEKDLTPAYEQMLRKHAEGMPNWTPGAVNSINMRYKNGGHVVTYSDDSILDIENGTPDTDRSSAIRDFMLYRNGK